MSSAIREARIAFGNDLTGMETEGVGVCGESVMRPRGALCGCCENTLLWDVETVLYGCWSKVGRSRFSSFLKGCPQGSSCGIGRLLIVISVCDQTFSWILGL